MFHFSPLPFLCQSKTTQTARQLLLCSSRPMKTQNLESNLPNRIIIFNFVFTLINRINQLIFDKPVLNELGLIEPLSRIEQCPRRNSGIVVKMKVSIKSAAKSG